VYSTKVVSEIQCKFTESQTLTDLNLECSHREQENSVMWSTSVSSDVGEARLVSGVSGDLLLQKLKLREYLF